MSEDTDDPDMIMDGVPVGVAMRRMRATKEKLNQLEDEYKKARDKLVNKIDFLGTFLLDFMNKSGVSNVNLTGVGRAQKSKRRRANCDDWGRFYSWVAETGNYHLQYKRLVGEQVHEYYEATGDIPPGVNMFVEEYAKFIPDTKGQDNG